MSVTFDYDLVIRAGATFDQTFTWLQGDPGTPVELTGVTARMHLRVAPDVVDPPLLDLSTANGGIVITGADGKVRVIVDAATTATLAGPGVFDLLLTWPDGSKQRLLQGFFNVTPGVTR